MDTKYGPTYLHFRVSTIVRFLHDRGVEVV